MKSNDLYRQAERWRNLLKFAGNSFARDGRYCPPHRGPKLFHVRLCSPAPRCRALQRVPTLQKKLEAENIYLQGEISKERNFTEIFGSSRAIADVLQRVEILEPTDSTILIIGQTGCGKEMIAQSIVCP